MTGGQCKIAVIIPCYKVKAQILKVIEAIPKDVFAIYCIDDACPEQSGQFIEGALKGKSQDNRVRVLYNEKNLGVGGAVMHGYREAVKDGADILVKIDGDGQMDPRILDQFTTPIENGQCDYTKGNRFYRIEDVTAMPGIRIFGNAVLSLMTKLSSGYWNIFDPTNGYTAIHANLVELLPLHKINERYFFESDILFRLNTLRARVFDIPMQAFYGDEESNLKIHKILLPFIAGHIKNFFKRIFYNYFLRDFNVASIELILGLALLIFGVFYGLENWAASSSTGVPATAGTVMLSGLPIIVGMQLVLSFLHYDIMAVPRHPVHPFMRTKNSEER